MSSSYVKSHQIMGCPHSISSSAHSDSDSTNVLPSTPNQSAIVKFNLEEVRPMMHVPHQIYLHHRIHYRETLTYSLTFEKVKNNESIYSMANFVSYSHLSLLTNSLIISLNPISMLKTVQEALSHSS